MTRKHFEQIAQAIHQQVEIMDAANCDMSHYAILNQLVGRFSKVFKAENPNFDEKRFREACKIS